MCLPKKELVHPTATPPKAPNQLETNQIPRRQTLMLLL